MGKKLKNIGSSAQTLLSCISVSLEASQNKKDVINTLFLNMYVEGDGWRIGALDRYGICLLVRFIEIETETYILLEVKERGKK